ncbi:hypothetical protein EVAR_29589_1 [Eumeta japonica]|uniref:Uncharacterized protein n=1 Tax=Eumeta variegata TaxID=151549 RepID=A0A4C1VUE0_EUMVA|nr:hypothetical protein EVAR_29589_1 [Eumeta japonica]
MAFNSTVQWQKLLIRTTKTAQTIYEFSCKNIKGEDVKLDIYKGHTLLSRASQDDGWLATVSDAPLPLHFMGGASVAHDTEQPAPQLTPARRSSKWDAAERHQSSRRPPHEPGCQDPHDVALGRRAAYRVAARRRGTRVGILSTTSARSDRRGADTCASLQARGARCRQWPAAAAQERPIRKWLGVRPSASAGSTSTSVNGLELTMCSASSSRVWRTSSRGLLSQCSGQRGFDRSHQRSQAPPMFGAPGGMNFKLWCGRRLLSSSSRVPLVCSSVLCLRRRNSCRCPNTSLSSSSSSDESTQSQYHGV